MSIVKKLSPSEIPTISEIISYFVPVQHWCNLELSRNPRMSVCTFKKKTKKSNDDTASCVADSICLEIT